LSERIFERMPQVIGHRGAMGHAPENTLASIRAAAELGAQWVEFDVAMTSCGELVLFHDDTLMRTTGMPGRLARTPYSRLRELDVGGHFGQRFYGERIPTLVQAIELTAELGLGVNLELKVPDALAGSAVEKLAPLLRQYWQAAQPLLLSTFSTTAMVSLAEQMPERPRGLLVEQIPRDWLAQIEGFGAVSLHCDEVGLDAAAVREVVEQGCPLLAYTVNDSERAEQLFEWGVRAVFSDYPERIKLPTPA
jgi:glycerophosphoryl diester phosphodiesterase